MNQPSLRHPGRWLWLLLAIPALLGFFRLRFETEVFDLLPHDLPSVRGLKLYQAEFSNARELLITLEAADAEHAEAAAKNIAEKLRAQPALVSTVTWMPPWLEHPDQSAELLAYFWLNQPNQVFSDLVHRLEPGRLQETFASARDQLTTSFSPEAIAKLSYDPLGFTQLPESVAAAAPSFANGQEGFASDDGKFRILYVKARPQLTSYRDCDAWLRSIKPIVIDGAAEPGGAAHVKLGFTGRPAFVAEIALGMQRDMTLSVGGTAAIIAVLFWLAHRRVKPMLWLLTLLALVLASTVGIGGLLFGTMNVISVGFAAILLGLAVDYAVVHYQEALTHPRWTIPQIRHAIAPSILWAAVTTISAFLVLNLGGLPGLGQLGTLVAVGVCLAACIMVFEFLPPLFPERHGPDLPPDSPAQPTDVAAVNSTSGALQRAWFSRGWLVHFVTAVLALICTLTLLRGFPRIDPTANALRPKNSASYAAMEQVQAHLSQKRDPLWIIVSGETETQVGQRLDALKPVLSHAQSNQMIGSFLLPTALWPKPDNQATNRSAASQLAAQRERFREAASANGFAATSLAMAEAILSTWTNAVAHEGVFWPTNDMSRWIFEKVIAVAPGHLSALGLITPPALERAAAAANIEALQREFHIDQVVISGWELLGAQIFARVAGNFWKILIPMICLVLASLWFAFRRPREILLSLATLIGGAAGLLTVMHFLHWSWNLLNLMAVPLVLGTGVDYSIFMLLALRRFKGDISMAWNSVGRALLLCGGTAVAGFGSLAFSSNAGMASLGQVCAVGIGCNMLIAIFLLPAWWSRLNRSIGDDSYPNGTANSAAVPLSSPSSLYRSDLWLAGLWVVRHMPGWACRAVARTFSLLYWSLARRRKACVIANLLPVVDNDHRAAARRARYLFKNFEVKLVDLWRYEAGLPIDHLIGEESGWEHFRAARAQRRGTLILTPHLGNWEFGGRALARQGVDLQVITLAEPGDSFTALRQAARARWKVKTLVIGNDPFAFLEIIRHLEAGATVALLVDRPPPPTATTVQLFGRSFEASIAAAELARASGCVLLPAYVARQGRTYAMHILPSIEYDRASLRSRDARQALTQKIMTIFEPLIRQHADQWYHFVPVWLKREG